MHLTLRLLGIRHPSFIARTVFVKNNNVDDACRLVNRILGKEGILEQFRLTRYYEKPFQVRIQLNDLASVHSTITGPASCLQCKCYIQEP